MYKFEIISNKHKQKMTNSIQNIKEHFEWEDGHIFDYFTGKLPEINPTSFDSDSINIKINDLNKTYKSYNYFSTDQKSFLQKLENKIKEIHDINPHWYGLSLDTVKYYMDLHHACILTGEGGIGKSYFIYQLEKEFCKLDISHICVYGKYQEIGFDIDFTEISSFAENKPFIFIIDAFNELTDVNKMFILGGIQNLLKNKNIRIIITYRTYALEEAYCKKLDVLISTKISFPGISFESAINVISKYPVKELYNYSDILFSNNALLISKLISILIKFPADRNSINSVTYILEYDFKETIGLDYWEKTKEVTKWMYYNNTKEIPLSVISSLITDSTDYIEKLISTDFIFTYTIKEATYVVFQIESVHDYLIARFFFEDSKGKTEEETLSILASKIKAFPSAREAFILGLFDKLGNDYEQIYFLLEKSNLLNELSPEIIRKVKFDSQNIPDFLSVFYPNKTIEQLLWFAGFSDKPFNCVNFQNQLLLESSKNQLTVLSKCLSFHYDTTSLAQRLKNILYFVNFTIVEDRVLKEYFFTALWCCAASNENVRIFARKLLFDIVRIKEEYINILIQLFPKIYDFYIQDAVIETLFYHKENHEIKNFFMELKQNSLYLSAVNIARISDYLNLKYDYINWEKKNLFSLSTRKISNEFESLLFRIDAYAKNLLHFRYWSRNKIDEMTPSFLNVAKNVLINLNRELKDQFSCVNSGECKGKKEFEKTIIDLYKIKLQYFPANSFLKSFENVFHDVFNKYEYQFNEKDEDSNYRHFNNSLLRKLTVISQDIFYGSLMCNYFTDEFSSYNYPEDLIGYTVYYPLKYDPSQNITAPIPTFSDTIEKLQNKVLNCIDYSMNKDEIWVKDAALTKKNVLSIISTPIGHGKHAWITLGAKIFLKDPSKDFNSWQDNYDISCCSSDEITINGTENDKNLTIDYKDYYGLLEEYNCKSPEPELCMEVRQISSYNDMLDETNLLLPPAKLLRDLELKPDYKNLSWINNQGEVIIYCNNNKSDYYNDFITNSIFIRKDVFDNYVQNHTLKYFVFTERYIPGHGFEDDTCFNFEIEHGKIQKEYLHYKTSNIRTDSCERKCNDCPIGLDKKYDDLRNRSMNFSFLDQIIKQETRIYDEKS